MNALRSIANKVTNLVSQQPRRRRNGLNSQPTEALEDRVLLSNVTVELQNGDLIIVGDEGNNEVTVSQRGFGFILVQGHNGTTINGSATPQHLSTGVVQDDVRVDFTAGGRNKLKIDGLRIGADVVYRGGDDRDVVGIFDGSVGGDINIRTEDGYDVVAAYRVAMDGKFTVNTGRHPDAVGIGGQEMRVNANVNTGSGKDDFVASFLGDGSRLKLRTGSANDEVFIFNTELDTLDANTGKGNDDLWMRDVTVDGRGKVKGGHGTDNFQAINSTAMSIESSFEGSTVTGGALQAVTLASQINDLFANL